jgi:4-hydroxybenzoate polyprenyltransferase
MPQAVLGVAFSFGIPMAYAAIQDQVPPVMWWLLVGNLAWVLAYDTEYAMVDRNDDLKIGIRTSAITLGRFDVLGVMGFYALCLLCWFVAGHMAGRGMAYNLALLAAAGQALWHGLLIKDRQREDCFKAFRLNHWLGLTVWMGIVLDTLMSNR